MSLALGCVAENTPKYLGQALRLVQSVRWFGGALNEADLYVCVVDDINSDYRKELERYGATIHIVQRFSTKHPPSNKLRFLELQDLAKYDKILMLDCDIIVVRDPSPHLFHSDFTAKIADVPTVPLDTFQQLFSAFGLPMPEATQRCTASGESTIPYFNAGVLAFSRRAMNALVPKWIELNQQLITRIELLGRHDNFCEQASLSLALAATGIPFEAVGNAFNFPMHFNNPISELCLADIDPFIIHYHWLADPSGYILPSTFSAVDRRINEFNARLRQERESHSVDTPIPEGTGHPRDISPSTFHDALQKTRHPDLLRTLVGLSRAYLGFFTSHFPRSLEYPWLLDQLAGLAPTSILDIGSGVSPVPLFLAEAGHTVTTVDSHAIVRTPATRAEWNEWGFLDYGDLHSGITSQHRPIEGMVAWRKFDVVYSISVIEHMPKTVRRRVLERASLWLKPEGHLLLTLDLVPQTEELWNLSEGKIVDEQGHGTMPDVLEELASSGFQVDDIDYFREIPDSSVDVVCISATLKASWLAQAGWALHAYLGAGLRPNR